MKVLPIANGRDSRLEIRKAQKQSCHPERSEGSAFRFLIDKHGKADSSVAKRPQNDKSVYLFFHVASGGLTRRRKHTIPLLVIPANAGISL